MSRQSSHSNLENRSAMAPSFTTSTRNSLCFSALSLVLLLVTASCDTDPLDCSSDDDNLPISPATGTIKCSAEDRQALLEFKSSISEDPNKALASWISTGSGAYNCCAWNGVTCDGETGRVVRLKLPQLSLKGKLAPGLGALSHLLVLTLYENSFSGAIPSSYGNLTSLQKFCLASNGLSGPIPESFGRLASLQMLHLTSNKLSGPLPHSIGNMSSLQEFHIYDNEISGPIPPSFGLLSNLFDADMGHNKLSGRIPDSFNYNLTSLFNLFLDKNQITGLPKNLNNLKVLQWISLSNNNLGRADNLGGLATVPQLTELDLSSCNLQGPFPSWIARFPHPDSDLLSDEVTPSIDLSHNALTGPIPAYINSLPDYWQIIALNNNRLSGKIPSTLGNLTALLLLNLAHNQLSGPIPSSFSQLQSLHSFNVSFNRLTGQIPQVSPFTTFNVSAYEGNRGLCGSPLPACKSSH